MGRHIIFEGPDGGGKDTQIQLVKSWLEESGRTVWVTRTPSYHPIGKLITESYFGRSSQLVPDPEARATMIGSLNVADMIEHDREVRQKLQEEAGDDLFVLQSRGWISTYCYNSASKPLQRLLLEQLRHILHVPAATVFLHASPDACIGRIAARDQVPLEEYENKITLQLVMNQWGYLRKYLSSALLLELDTTGEEPFCTLERIQTFFATHGIVHGN